MFDKISLKNALFSKISLSLSLSYLFKGQLFIVSFRFCHQLGGSANELTELQELSC